MNKILILAASAFLASASWANDSIQGTKWKTIDDKTGKPKFLIEIKKVKDNVYNGSIVDVFDVENKLTYKSCNGRLMGKRLQGTTVINSLKLVESGKFKDGKILDPDSGRIYSLEGELVENGKKLKLRGYLGISALVRSQTWLRVN